MKRGMIDKRSLEIVLTDQKAEMETWDTSSMCVRAEETQVDLDSPQAQVVIGVRRSGKSTLCMQALKVAGVNFAYVDFDDERLSALDTNQLNDVLEVLYKIYGDFKYLFLDEIQNIEGWPLFVNRLLRIRMHIVLTGSNAKLLSNDLATHLTGRSSEIELYPFSFVEFCAMLGKNHFQRTTKGIAELRKAFDEYLLRGGFPELMSIKNEKKYISNLVDNILRRDIEQRYNIAYSAQFESLAQHLLNVSPTIVSTMELASIFDIKSAHTVRNYVQYLKQAYLLVGVKRYSAKSKERMVNEKLYAVDVALMNQRDNAMMGENLGWRLETVVLNHLVRKCKNEGWDIYYLRTRSAECDFVVCKGNKVLQCIQVSYDISADKTRKREINGLLQAYRHTHCEDLLLLTDHEREDVEANGVRICIKPVYELAMKHNVPVLFHSGWDNVKYGDVNVAEEVIKEYPHLQFVCCHCWYPEISKCMGLIKYPNIAFDLSSVADNESVLDKISEEVKALAEQVPDRVMFGSDSFGCSMEGHIKFVTDLGLVPDIEQKVLADNAIRIYGL